MEYGCVHSIISVLKNDKNLLENHFRIEKN